MPTPTQIEKQINELVKFLVEKGLSDDQNFAFQQPVSSGFVKITFEGANLVSIALKDRVYREIYQLLVQERVYNVKMLDGALIQMTYEFSAGTLRRHRLAFFPSPHLEEFQNNPDIYLDDEIYADVVAKNIVSFPVRFDYDDRDNHHKVLVHPKSHLTLGQYENCRIPVTAPLTPVRFVDFILRNFYHTAYTQYADELPAYSVSFAESILPSERKVVHVMVPA